MSPSFDQDHYKNVMNSVEGWAKLDDRDDFLMNDFTHEDIKIAMKKLNANKAPGLDGVTKEHLIHAGKELVDILVILYKWILQIEYIPSVFRKGVQIPLYKGKNTSTLITDNFRGITFLSVFNKSFEIMLWKRIEVWWNDKKNLSDNQGACKKGISSLHTALLLQESIACNLEGNKKVFVTFLDVSKAFDSVWTEGLFYQLRNLGIKGKLWRILYFSYLDFQCRVRIQDKFSGWYNMRCGIHQGGFLSLLKYAAFINSLLTVLQESGLCCFIQRIPCSPLGYADDIASASSTKNKTENVLALVNEHSKRWRYSFNAKKSAILVYGETPRESTVNAQLRRYKLGSEYIKERKSYDHVGYKACIDVNSTERVEDKTSKGRRALFAASSIGIKKGGINMMSANIVIWSMIIPIVTYAAELWILNQKEIEKLDEFQRFAGRRIQRFHKRSPKETSFAGLGWLRLENFIYAKKMIFIRTLTIMKDDCIYKQVLILRTNEFCKDIEGNIINRHNSPIYDLLRIAMVYGIFDIVINMILRNNYYSKKEWSGLVWKRAWEIEDEDWSNRTDFFSSVIRLNTTIGKPNYLIWWSISDANPKLIRACEVMAELVCGSSKLKCHDPTLKRASFNMKMCNLCNDHAREDINHLVMACKWHEQTRMEMFNEMKHLNDGIGRAIIDRADICIDMLLGKPVNGFEDHDLICMWKCACKWISKIYFDTLKNREGVG